MKNCDQTFHGTSFANAPRDSSQIDLFTLDVRDRFAVAHSRQRDPQTSKDAARSMRQAANAQCAAVLNALKALGRAGAEQIGQRCGMEPYAVRKRLADLEHADLARPTEETRKTKSGRSERVWVA